MDYGVGNLKSVTNAMKYLGLESVITGEAGVLERADAILLPGVGAFPDAAERLRATALDAVICAQALKKPVLGICLGMQLLFTEGEEGRPCRGLDLIPGRVERIQTDRKLPHIGWNSLALRGASALLRGVEEGAWVYFVHSYCAVADAAGDVIAVTDHGATVTAAVQRGNVYGCQFHPEKSGEAGLQILKNFGELNR